MVDFDYFFCAHRKLSSIDYTYFVVVVEYVAVAVPEYRRYSWGGDPTTVTCGSWQRGVFLLHRACVF